MIGINRCLPPLQSYSIWVSPEIKFTVEADCHFLKQLILKSVMFSLILCIIWKTNSISKKKFTPQSGVDREDWEEKKRADVPIPVNPVQFVCKEEKMMMITGRETHFWM